MNKPSMSRVTFAVLFPLMVVAVVLATIGEELWNTLVHIRLELRVEFASLRRIWKELP